MSTVSGTWRGPNIVKDSSLVLYLDASAKNSYNDLVDAGVWKDMSGNNNTGTLTNGPTYDSANGGNIVFDGTNDYVSTANTFTLTEATFITWVNLNGSQAGYTGVLHSRITNPVATGCSLSSGNQTTNQLGYEWNAAVNTYSWSSGLIVPTSAWSMIAISVSSTSATAYLCQSSGITSATNTVNHSSVSTNFNVGRDLFAASRYFKGNISQALIYNKALSAAEIQQNYNAVRGRFGI